MNSSMCNPNLYVHFPPQCSPSKNNEPMMKVDSPCPSESGFADGASKTTTTLLVTTPPRFVFSPAKKDSPPPGASSHSSKAKDRDQSSTSTTMNSTSRVRVPWPGSRHKESPNQHHYLTSPRGSTATAVSQLDSVTEFLEAAIHFPKQQKSPSTLRRVPRKKTLRKSKVVLKKEAAPESTDLLERIDLGLNAPSSPPKTLLKRKRRKSRNSSSSSSVENAKEKREMKAVAVEELTVASDDPMPSTSATLSPPLVSTLLRSPLVKKKKLIRLKKTSLVLKKKRATE